MVIRLRLPVVAMLLASLSVGASAAPEGDLVPQVAVAADMRIFDPYIGRFESQPRVFDDGETRFHYEIEYRWFDDAKSIVKFQVATVIPSQQRTIVNAEGFYAFDPFTNRIFVFGAFSRGITGKGWVGQFDLATGKRENWVKAMGADGVVTEVHDTFERIDGDTLKNETSVRRGGEGGWTVVYEDTFTRIGA